MRSDVSRCGPLLCAVVHVHKQRECKGFHSCKGICFRGTCLVNIALNPAFIGKGLTNKLAIGALLSGNELLVASDHCLVEIASIEMPQRVRVHNHHSSSVRNKCNEIGLHSRLCAKAFDQR